MGIQAFRDIKELGKLPVSEATTVRLDEAIVRAERVVEMLQQQKQDIAQGQQVDWGYFGDASRVGENLNDILVSCGLLT